MRENNDKKYDLTPEEYNKCLTRAEIATFMKGETVENICYSTGRSRENRT